MDYHDAELVREICQLLQKQSQLPLQMDEDYGVGSSIVSKLSDHGKNQST